MCFGGRCRDAGYGRFLAFRPVASSQWTPLPPRCWPACTSHRARRPGTNSSSSIRPCSSTGAQIESGRSGCGRFGARRSLHSGRRTARLPIRRAEEFSRLAEDHNAKRLAASPTTAATDRGCGRGRGNRGSTGPQRVAGTGRGRVPAAACARATELVRSEFEPTTWRACWEVTVQGRPASEVAQELGISVNAVYLAKSRVLARSAPRILAGLLD